MPSKQTARSTSDVVEKATPEKLAPAESQEFLRDQVTEPTKTTSYLLGDTLEGSGDLSAERGDEFMVGGKMTSSKLGTSSLSSQISAGDLGSGRGDEFLVDGKMTSSKLGTNSLSSQISAGDLGSGRDDEFMVDGKMTSSKLGTNSLSSQISAGDLGSGRDDEFMVDGKMTSSKLGTNSLSSQISAGDLGSGRDDEFMVDGKMTSSKLGKNSLSSQISAGDLGSGRDDEFMVDGKMTSSKLGKNSLSSQISAGDLGSGREDEFMVDGKMTSSKLGKNSLISQISAGDLGSGRDPEKLAIQNPDIVLGESLETQIPGLVPEAGENVSVSLPLAPEVAAAKIEAGEQPSQELIQEAAKAVEKATLIHPEDIPPGLLEALPAETILRFAFSPEDMGALDLQTEHEAVAKVADVLTLNNPTEATMKHVLSTGQFEDVIWSGHGSTDGLWITDLDGKAKKLPAEEVANLLKDTGVQEVLLNVCNGGVEVDNALASEGINSFSYERSIIDAEAVADATNFAESGSLWDIDQRSKKEIRNDDRAGQVMTARRHKKEQWMSMSPEDRAAVKQERTDQLLTQVGDWVTDKNDRKGKGKGKGKGAELLDAMTGMGGKGVVKRLANMFKGKGKKKKSTKKKRKRWKGLKKG